MRDLSKRHLRIARRQFNNEVLRYAQLKDCKGVVRFYGVSQTGTSPGEADVFVTERMQGGGLDVLVEQGRVEVGEVVRISLMVCNALAELHRRGFAHGDVKPSNVLFSEPGGKGVAKLVDLGLCRWFEGDFVDGVFVSCQSAKSCVSAPESSEDSLFGGNCARGAPAYLSPEAWGGNKVLADRVVAQRADVYALAVIMYQLECGLNPWEGVPEWGVFVAVCNEGRRPMWKGRERVGGLRRLVEWCWRQDACDRPSAEQVAGVLERMISQGVCMSEADFDDFGVPRAEDLPARGDFAELEEPPSRRFGAALGGGATGVDGANMDMQRDEVGVQEEAFAVETPHVDVHVLERVEQREAELDLDVPEPQSISRYTDIDAAEAVSGRGYVPESRSSSRYTGIDAVEEERAQMEEEVPAAVQETELIPVRKEVEYAFKKQVLSNDVDSLVQGLAKHERDPHIATRALEALAVVLEGSPENASLLCQSRGVRVTAGVLSRFGRLDARLCKAACVVVIRLATSRCDDVERELRTCGACGIVLNVMRWHPAYLPVIQNGVCALSALCRASTSLCSIAAELGACAASLRALARSTGSFGGDIPVATAALDVLTSLARVKADVRLEGLAQGVLSCCDCFRVERLDEQCVSVLYSITRRNEGRDAAVRAPGCLDVMSRLIDRCVDGGHTRTLTYALCIVSELAKSSLKADTTSAFLGSTIVESVIKGGDLIREQRGQSNNALLPSAGLDCLRNMSMLGKDVCGALQIANVFDFTNILIAHAPDNRTVALKATFFMQAILDQLKDASHASTLDLAFDLLNSLRERWKGDAQIMSHIRPAFRVLSGAANRSIGLGDGQEEEEESPRSGLKIFVRRVSQRHRQQNSLRVGGHY